MKFVALFRGINVGKSVQVPMKSLKAMLEDLGFTGVTTYLNSGNALFESEKAAPEVTTLIESELERKFGQKIPTLVKTSSAIIDIAKSIPSAWGNNEKEQTYVAYLFPEAARPEIVSELPIKRQYMEIFYAHECIIWNIPRENYNRSQITKIMGHRSYSQMTTRNCNTARKLAELCQESPPG